MIKAWYFCPVCQQWFAYARFRVRNSMKLLLLKKMLKIDLFTRVFFSLLGTCCFIDMMFTCAMFRVFDDFTWFLKQVAFWHFTNHGLTKWRQSSCWRILTALRVWWAATDGTETSMMVEITIAGWDPLIMATWASKVPPYNQTCLVEMDGYVTQSIEVKDLTLLKSR